MRSTTSAICATATLGVVWVWIFHFYPCADVPAASDLRLTPGSVFGQIPQLVYTTSRRASGGLIQIVRLHNPNWKVTVIPNGQPAVKLINKYCGPKYANAYQLLAVPAFQADLLRYCMLWSTGGVWMDDDLVLLRPLADIVPVQMNVEAMLARDLIGGCGHPGIMNQFMVARPGALIFSRAMDAIVNTTKRRRRYFHNRRLALHFTGPALLWDLIQNTSSAVPWRVGQSSAFHDGNAIFDAVGNEIVLHMPMKSNGGYGRRVQWGNIYVY